MIKAQYMLRYLGIWLIFITIIFFCNKAPIKYEITNYWGNGAVFYKSFDNDMDDVVISRIQSFNIVNNKIYLMTNKEFIVLDKMDEKIFSYNVYNSVSTLMGIYRDTKAYRKYIFVYKDINAMPTEDRKVYESLKHRYIGLWLPYLNVLESKYY